MLNSPPKVLIFSATTSLPEEIDSFSSFFAIDWFNIVASICLFSKNDFIAVFTFLKSSLSTLSSLTEIITILSSPPLICPVNIIKSTKSLTTSSKFLLFGLNSFRSCSASKFKGLILTTLSNLFVSISILGFTSIVRLFAGRIVNTPNPITNKTTGMITINFFLISIYISSFFSF